MSGLVRALLGLVVLAVSAGTAGATMLWSSGSGAGVVANTCTAGDFFTAVDGSGNFTCSTPAGSGNVSTSGTPVDNQLAIWTDATHIEGDAALTFDTATNTLTTTTFAGALTGNASTATALAANGANCSAGNAPLGVDASGAVEGCFSVLTAEVDGSTTNELQNIFQTMDAPSGTDPVADTTTDTLQFLAGGIVTITGDSTADSITISATEVDGSTTNELQNIFQTIDTSSGTDPVADTTTDTLALTGTAPVTVTGDSATDTVTLSLADVSDCTNQFVTGAGANLSLTCTTATLAGAQFANQGTTTTVLHGNAAGNPSWGGVVSADITNDTIVNADINSSAAIDMSKTAATGGTGIDINTNQLDFDATELTSLTWSAGGSATAAWTFSLSGLADPVFTAQNNGFNINGAVLYGHSVTTNDLTLQANSADTTTGEINLNAPRLDIYPSFPAAPTGDHTLIRSAPTTTLTGGAADYTMVEAAPVITVADTTASQYFRAAGSVDRTGISGGTLYQVTGFYNAPTLTSSTAGGPLFQDAFYDATVVSQVSGTATQNTYQPISFLSKPTYKAASGATLTIGQTTGVDLHPNWGVAGGTFTNTTYSAVRVHKPCVDPDTAVNYCAGTPTLTNYIGLDVQDLAESSNATVTSPMSLRSVGTTTEMRHAGPARFGATGAVTSGFTLDVAGVASGTTTNGNAIIDGYIDVGDEVADQTTGAVNVIDIAPDVALTGAGGTLRGVSVSPTLAQSDTNTFIAFQVNPTITQSGSTKFPFFYGLNFAGTVTTSGATSSQTAALMRHATTYTTSTANVQPVGKLTGMSNVPTVNSTATSGSATVTIITGLDHAPVISRSGAGSMTVTDDVAVNVGGTYTESAGTLAVTNRTGLKFSDVTNTSSATAITNNIGVDIAALSTATNNIGIRNADTTVYTPPTTVTVGAAFTLTATATTQKLDASAARTSDTTTAINDGVADGQLFTIINVDTTPDIITIKNAANTDLGADCALNSGGTLTVMWVAVLSNWVQIACSAN